MKDGMPLYTDDHSILVTAEFWENGYLLKNGGSNIQRFEIDLITRDDITLEQFLLALYSGIHWRLQNKYGIEPTEEDVQYLYWDDLSEPTGELLGNIKEYADSDEESNLSPRERAIQNWLICWKLFRACYMEYKNGYAETSDADRPAVFPPRMDPHPVISCASIDKRVLDQLDAVNLTHASQYWLEQKKHGKKMLRELGFVNSTRIIFDPAMWHRADCLFGDKISEYKLQKLPPAYRIPNHPDIIFDDTPIRILPPSKPAEESSRYLIPIITAPLITVGILWGINDLSGGIFMPDHLYWHILGTILVMAGIGLLGWYAHYRAIQVRIKMLCRNYQTYIRQVISDIRKRQKTNAKSMRQKYPPALEPIFKSDLVRMANAVEGDLFSRTPESPDYLKTRLGLSKPQTRLVPSSFEITCVRADEAFSGVRYANIQHTPVLPFTVLPPAGPFHRRKGDTNSERFLFDLPEALVKEYSYLADAPVLLDIGRSRVIGALFQDSEASFRPFLANLVLDLCFHHSPDDLQIVMLFQSTKDERKQMEIIRYYKHLPHFRQLFSNHAPFAFQVGQANQLMDRVHALLNQRKINPQAKHPHILLITEESNWLQYHTLSRLLPQNADDAQSNPNGISFLVCSHFQRDIPRFCSQVIKVSRRGEWYLVPQQKIDNGLQDSLYAFKPDVLPYRQSNSVSVDERDTYFRAFKSISAISCMKVGRDELIPMTGFWDLLAFCAEENGMQFDFYSHENETTEQRDNRLLNVLKQYRDIRMQMNRSRPLPLNTLAVPVGFSAHKMIHVDLHSTADGPNLLLLSDRGAGKTQFILTYLQSLYMHYSSEDVQLILVDPSIAGLCHRTDLRRSNVMSCYPDSQGEIDGAAIGLGALAKVEQIIKDRRTFFIMMGISSNNDEEYCGIDLYNLYIQDFERHAIERLGMSGSEAEHWLHQNRNYHHKHLPHIVVVLDNIQDLLGLMDPNKDVPVFLNQLARILHDAPAFGIHVILSTSELEPFSAPEWLELFQSRICLKHSDAEDALRCVGTHIPSEDFYPDKGRACMYNPSKALSVRFQVSYCGNYLLDRYVPPVRLTYAPPNGAYELLCNVDFNAADDEYAGTDWRPDLSAYSKNGRHASTDDSTSDSGSKESTGTNGAAAVFFEEENKSNQRTENAPNTSDDTGEPHSGDQKEPGANTVHQDPPSSPESQNHTEAPHSGNQKGSGGKKIAQDQHPTASASDPSEQKDDTSGYVSPDFKGKTGGKDTAPGQKASEERNAGPSGYVSPDFRGKTGGKDTAPGQKVSEERNAGPSGYVSPDFRGKTGGKDTAPKQTSSEKRNTGPSGFVSPVFKGRGGGKDRMPE